MRLLELRDYIGSELEVNRFRDYCPNGLQVEGRAEVHRIASAVTASQAVLESAVAWGADAILVHHGYFWRGEDATVTGIKKRRIAYLLQNEVSLLAYHLPLDAHRTWGNNTQLAQRLGLIEAGRFGEQDIACHGCLAQPKLLTEWAKDIADSMQREPQVIGDLQREIKRVAWCSGAAQSYFMQAVELGVDAFITGEISEQNVHIAHETGVAFISAGHHATERYGVQALAAHLAEQFQLEQRFFDQDIMV
ncbi:MAG: Nif3-like dinuclear metal center hexameric protein [Gallionella sp.]|nr:Nif3-like dinuclear metal center hexameric protein [Gallionella sp.]